MLSMLIAFDLSRQFRHAFNAHGIRQAAVKFVVIQAVVFFDDALIARL